MTYWTISSSYAVFFSASIDSFTFFTYSFSLDHSLLVFSSTFYLLLVVFSYNYTLLSLTCFTSGLYYWQWYKLQICIFPIGQFISIIFFRSDLDLVNLVHEEECFRMFRFQFFTKFVFLARQPRTEVDCRAIGGVCFLEVDASMIGDDVIFTNPSEFIITEYKAIILEYTTVVFLNDFAVPVCKMLDFKYLSHCWLQIFSNGPRKIYRKTESCGIYVEELRFT